MDKITREALEELETMLELLESVEKADCQIMYFPEGTSDRSPKTLMINTITLKDGSTLHDIPERTGGDYRGNRQALDVFLDCTRKVFARDLDGR